MVNKSVFIVFPHHLFQDIEPLKNTYEVYLVEEYLYFKQYKFHKRKLVFHRASMKYYESYLKENNIVVHYIEATDSKHDIRELLQHLSQREITQIGYYDVCDNWLEHRIDQNCKAFNLSANKLESPLFINTSADLESYFGAKTRFFQTDFYIQQRKKLKILIDENGKAFGGKWSFDAENRLKYPKNKSVPEIQFPPINEFYQEAIKYVEKNFANNYGTVSGKFIYATTHQESEEWLQRFLQHRFNEFGEYEDAIVDHENILHHGVLSPMLNVGLLTPLQIVDEAIHYSSKNEVPLNSFEGFIRQIIGWREFIRGVYIYKGTEERTMNFWNFNKKIPASFYDGTTGIEPIDNTIKKVLETGYCHHIERLMLLGNFMLLCEFNPDEVYKWFMELFIDSYDWVMVPNVYGMSQFADGGIMATKPYISGSSYVLKMSNFKKGNWCPIWDALFWHFMDKQRGFFSSNPRLGMLLNMFDKMDEEKKDQHLSIAKKWLQDLHK
ncbi:MAG: cryptochrome/photolyase family protein [Bacteroidales bacterium]|nr:cryptochrome/photolyase family protein [Bacteroidales bacterium]